MVSLRWGGLAARAVHFMSIHPGTQTEESLLLQHSLQAAQALQGWYNAALGTWDTTGWWNSANCLTVLADWASHVGPATAGLDVAGIVSNTFDKAQQTMPSTQKTLCANGLIKSTYIFHNVNKRGHSEFLNDYYDDEGWWALALIRAWDVTRQDKYLNMAERIFADMHEGTDATCGGGIWWSKRHDYKNAIANELYLSVAASLANRVADGKQQYIQMAKDQWTWFKGSGMINQDNLINDGLGIAPDGRCVNNGFPTWSYNQGVILGGLVELSKATGDRSYLEEAVKIATAAIARLSDENGIMHEVDRCEPNCGDDGSQFKGIFVRNLGYLQAAVPRREFWTAIRKNAYSIWAKDRNERNQLGIAWTGPPELGSGPNASTHSSAMDVLVAALVG
ncbi:hypothetical protein VTK26DRAFT_5109 [Humicola hyalothermophila]